MEAEAGEILQDWDWELLHQNSDSDSVLVNSVESNENAESDGFQHDSVDAMFQANYFSLDSSHKSYMTTTLSGAEEACSDNPSWTDPAELETRKNSAEFQSDSVSERSDDDRKFSEFKEMGFVQNEELQVGFEEIVANKNDKNIDGIGLGVMKFGNFEGSSEDLTGGSEILGEEKRENEMFGGENEGQSEVRKVDEMKNGMVWWKLPMELFKYCVFRVSPVWTCSMAAAAALLGFAILWRRLYKTMKKKKSRALELKLTVDDKKISQFMSRTARLNEAFSVVKRVPVIRPSLPAAGVTPWPVVSLR